ncbi:MAG: hypothetical protein WC469_03480 [Candidatus Omnitrophota bacterium]
MTENAKSPVLILVVLVFFTLALAGGAYYLLQKERAKSQSLQAELEDLRGKYRVTEAKLEESKKYASEVDDKFKAAQEQVDTLTRQLESEKADKAQALTRLEQLTTELNKQKELRSSLETKYQQAQEETSKIQSQLRELQDKKKELESKIQELQAKAEQLGQQGAQPEQDVNLGKVVVEGGAVEDTPAAAAPEASVAATEGPQSPRKNSSIPEGKVLVVNRDYNFAVINLGSKDGVRIDDIFTVYRGKKKLGDIKIEKIHDSMSAGTFLAPQLKDKINEGDRVIPSAK